MLKKFYLKLLMSLMLVALAVPQAMAAELTVAEGTKTNAYVPIHSTYWDTQGTISQVVYPASMLEDMVGANITAIKFYTNSDGVQISNGSMQISLGEVSSNPFTISTTTPISSGLTPVLTTGAPDQGLTEFTLEFTTPYTYNGGDLVFESKVVTAGTWSYTYFYGQSTTGNYYSFGRNQTYAFMPKTTFEYEGEAKPYDAKVTPTSLDFGKLPVDGNDTKNVTIQNKGTEALSFTISGLNTPFNTISVNGTVAAGEQIQIPVTFAPTTVGTFEGNMVISFPGTGLDNVTIPITGSAADGVCDGTDENEYLPIYGWYFDGVQRNEMIYPASMLSKYIGKNITALKFFTKDGVKYSGGAYKVSLATTTTSEFESANPLGVTLTTVKSGLAGTDGVSGNELTITFDEPFLYQGGNLLVDFELTSSGSAGHTTFIGENQENTVSYYDYAFSATSSHYKMLQYFLPKMEITTEESGATPVITVDPATVDAFSTKVGTPVTTTVNVSGENLTGDITASISGENADCFTAALENGVLTITYNPTAAGNHTATLTLSSTGAEDVTIALTGTATAPAVEYAVTISDNTGAHNYGNVLVNSSNVWTLTITNNGTQPVTPTLSGIEAPFSTTYTAAPLVDGESVSIEITFAPTEVNNYSNAITLSFPETTIADYTFELTGKGVDSFEPTAENEVVKLITVDKRSIYEPNFIDAANNNTTPQQLNCYDMRFKMAQPDDPDKQIKAGDLHPGNNLYEFYAIDDFGTEFRFATINLFAEGQPSSNPSVSAMDAPIKVTPSVEYYTEDGMPVHPSHTHNTTLNYTEKTYNDINELVDLEGVIDYVNDTWSANTATNAHPDHYKFQIRGVGQFGDLVTSLTSEYVESHMTGYGDQLVMPEGWERGMFAGPNNEASDNVHTFYYYDLYIKRSFFDERGITGPVTVVVNTTLSGSGFNADNYKAMSVNGVEQIIAKEEFKDYSWTVPLLDSIPTPSNVEHVSMGVIIRLVSTGADFNRTTGIYIYGGGTGVSNIDTVNIYKSSMNVKAYTQKQVDEDTDRNLVAMNGSGSTADVNVLAYADPAVTGYVLYENSSASTTGMTQVSTATHNADGNYTVSSDLSDYNGNYTYVRDESLGSIDGMWLPMYPAAENEYYLPVTWAKGIGDDGVVRSENNTYGSAMQQVEKNGSVDFAKKKCYKSEYTWVKDGVTYAIYFPEVELAGELPSTGYQLYNYRMWVDYEDDAPAWDFELDGKHIILTDKMDRPLYSGENSLIGGPETQSIKREWAFIAPNDLENVKLVARYYYKKATTSSGAPSLMARPTDSDRLYYVVENQVSIPMSDIITGIDNVASKTVASVKYYNVAGVESNVPFQGVNIEVTRYTDGSKSTRKIMK